jgi:glycine cleavage system aminomethyltransferase T
MRRQWLCALLALSVCLALVTMYAEMVLQGPKAEDILKGMTSADIVDLGSFHFLETTVAGR